MSKMRIFVPITKVDEEKRLVYGTVAEEVVDASREIFDYASSKPYFEKWSAGVEKASGGKSVGNLRAMHGKVAAGKLTDLGFNDAEKRIETCAHVVDDNEWEKVLSGVYTGFSMGGSYVRKWRDGDAKRYTACPVEVSLVDIPCIPTATFEVVKADGATELRKFAAVEPSNSEVVAAANAMAKASGGNWATYVEAARDVLIKARGEFDQDELNSAEEFDNTADFPLTKSADESAEGEKDEKEPAKESKEEGEEEEKDETVEDKPVEGLADEDEKPADAEKAAQAEVAQVWQATDGKTFAKKADCVAYQATLKKADEPSELQKSLDALKAAVAGEPVVEDPSIELNELAKTLRVLGKLEDEGKCSDPLRKSVWDISSFANAIESLACIQQCLHNEKEWERDGSKIPEQLKQKVVELTAIFLACAKEEMAELVSTLKPDIVGDMITTDPTDDPEVAIVAAAANKVAGDKPLLQKVGARNSKNDKKRLQGIHDYLVELGVVCDPEATKAAEAEELQKRATEAEQRAAKAEAEIAAVVPQIEELRKQVTAIMNQPMPGAPRLNVVDKNGAVSPLGNEPGAAEQSPVEKLAGMIEKHGMDGVATAVIKMSQQHGTPLMHRGEIQNR